MYLRASWWMGYSFLKKFFKINHAALYFHQLLLSGCGPYWQPLTGLSILYVLLRQCVDLVSEPLGTKSPPEPVCAPTLTPPLSTMPPTDTRSLLTSSSPSEGVLGEKGNLTHIQSFFTGYTPNIVRKEISVWLKHFRQEIWFLLLIIEEHCDIFVHTVY